MILDLHSHTTASDGTYPPEEMVRYALKKKVDVLAITDHDTISGAKSLIGKTFENISLILGVEISALFPTDSLHILGYGLKDIEKVEKVLADLIKYRDERNKLIVEKMQTNGINIDLEYIKTMAKGEAVGRPHFARALLEKGYVSSINEAFDKYLKDGGLFFVEKKRLTPKESVELIKSSGGIAVFAHPFETRLPNLELEKLVKELVSYGLDGLEVFYPKHDASQVKTLLKIVRKYDLMITAGNDFHGHNREGVDLGVEIPFKYLRKFLSAVEFIN